MKRLTTLCLAACLTAALIISAGALDYAIDVSEGPDHDKSTSVEVVHTAGGRALKNKDVSKNAAFIPPGFRSASAGSMITGAWLTPNLAPENMVVDAVNSGGIPIVFPPSADASTILPAEPEQRTGSAALGYTPVTSDLYYSGDYLDILKIPSVSLSVRVYEDTGSSTFARGVGHSESASIWNGNVGTAGHNRGVWDDFGDLHALERGDIAAWITKLGIRAYEVTPVEGVRETNTSDTALPVENILTLHTCAHNRREYRWRACVVEVV